jgi:hypothetical protein
MTIWKYPLGSHQTTVSMPKGADILCVQTQNEVPTIWCRVDPNAARLSRTFVIVGTGHDCEKDAFYIGTFQLSGGAFVFHVFETTR